MPLLSHRRRAPVTVTHTAPRRGGFFSKYRTRRARPARAPVAVHHGHHHHTTHHTHVVQKRHATLGDKISGALLKLKGTLTGRPGQKAAGTRRMHGTDGRGQAKPRRRFF